VLAAEGYPGAPVDGVPIHLEELPGMTLVHAGTREKDGQWVTSGGRVLDLVTVAPDLLQARQAVEEALRRIHWPGMQVRRDIGLRALQHAQAGRTVADPFL
jgi:phosphoribosylamine-glycine ligase